jgi:hypothetical protein
MKSPGFIQGGKVLFSTLIIGVLGSFVVGALLLLSQQHHYFTMRSAAWCSEIPIAEAGVEEAMAHLNSRPKNLDQSGWEKNGGLYAKTGPMKEGYYYTTFSSDVDPVVVSVGFARIPRQTNYTSRTVVALTKRARPPWGFVGKTGVSMNGNPYIDSYNSSDPDYSTGGRYDPLKRSDQAGVGTLETNAGAITATKIYGSAATGPKGTVVGSVGDGEYLASNSGQQSGHVFDDFNMAIPNASLPTNWSPTLVAPLPGIVDGVYYGYILNNRDYEVSGNLNLSKSTDSYYINGKVRIWFKGDFKMSGGPYVQLGPKATLEIYMSGSMDLSGKAVMNSSGIPGNCTIYGLPTCTSMKYTGTAEAYCRLYAPNATLTIGGDFDFFGEAIANRLQFSGTAAIHYDEALSTNTGPRLTIVSWEEL